MDADGDGDDVDGARARANAMRHHIGPDAHLPEIVGAPEEETAVGDGGAVPRAASRDDDALEVYENWNRRRFAHGAVFGA